MVLKSIKYFCFVKFFFSLIQSFFHLDNLKVLKLSDLPFELSLLWLFFSLDIFRVFCDPFKCTISRNGYGHLVSGLISPKTLFQDLMAKVHKICCSIPLLFVFFFFFITCSCGGKKKSWGGVWCSVPKKSDKWIET